MTITALEVSNSISAPLKSKMGETTVHLKYILFSLLLNTFC